MQKDSCDQSATNSMKSKQQANVMFTRDPAMIPPTCGGEEEDEDELLAMQQAFLSKQEAPSAKVTRITRKPQGNDVDVDVSCTWRRDSSQWTTARETSRLQQLRGHRMMSDMAFTNRTASFRASLAYWAV